MRSALLSALVPSFSIRPTREHVDHSEQVVGELSIGAFVFLVSVIEKDESGTRLLDDPLDKFDAESGESVLVGHHNFSDQAFLDMSQKPLEAFPFVVETRRDVFVDFVVWELGLHGGNLSCKIVLLLAG